MAATHRVNDSAPVAMPSVSAGAHGAHELSNPIQPTEAGRHPQVPRLGTEHVHHVPVAPEQCRDQRRSAVTIRD